MTRPQPGQGFARGDPPHPVPTRPAAQPFRAEALSTCCLPI
jgi:hypothetical protein